MKTENKDRIYFCELPGGFGVEDEPQIVAVRYGETQYNETTVYTRDHMAEMNRRQGITDNDAQTAMTCSMFNLWDKFGSMVVVLDERDRKARKRQEAQNDTDMQDGGRLSDYVQEESDCQACGGSGRKSRGRGECEACFGTGTDSNYKTTGDK